jgi:hypothetical protein
MRIERDIVSNIAFEDVRRRHADPAHSRLSSDTGSTLTSTADLVCLSMKVHFVEPDEQVRSRSASIDTLKSAYEAGAIRPDAARLASTLLRWSYDPAAKDVR